MAGLGESSAPRKPRSGRAARSITGSASDYVTCSLDDASFNLHCWGANDTGKTSTGSPDQVIVSPAKALLTSVNQVALKHVRVRNDVGWWTVASAIPSHGLFGESDSHLVGFFAKTG